MVNGTKMQIYNTFFVPQYKEVPQVLAELGLLIWGERYGVGNDNVPAPVTWTVKYCKTPSEEIQTFTKEALTPNVVDFAYIVADNATKVYKQELAETRNALDLALHALNNSSAIHFKDPELAYERGKAIDAVSAALERKVVDWLPPKV